MTSPPTRRSFLKIMGVAPAVAKEVVDKEVIKLSGMTVPGTTPVRDTYDGGAISGRLPQDMMEQFIKIKSPDFIEEERWKRRLRNQRAVLPEVSVLKSVSIFQKLRISQRLSHKRASDRVARFSYKLKKFAWEKTLPKEARDYSYIFEGYDDEDF